MNTEDHASLRAVVDKILAGAASLQEEQSLREHVVHCNDCHEYLNTGSRVIASLGGFSFDAAPGSQAKVMLALHARARQLEVAAPTRRRLMGVCATALVLLIAGSFCVWQFSSLLTVFLHLQPTLVQKAVLWLWVLPSLCFFLLFPALPLLSRPRERLL